MTGFLVVIMGFLLPSYLERFCRDARASLTKDETTMLVHFGEGKSQQFTLVRIEKPEGEGSPNGR
jgi:hypothetical protein